MQRYNRQSTHVNCETTIIIVEQQNNETAKWKCDNLYCFYDHNAVIMMQKATEKKTKKQLCVLWRNSEKGALEGK